MTTESPLPQDHPILKSFDEFEKTDDYQNAFRWAAEEQHRRGSLWRAFVAGYLARGEQLIGDLKDPWRRDHP